MSKRSEGRKRVLFVAPESDRGDERILAPLALLESRHVEIVLADADDLEGAHIEEFDAMVVAGIGEEAAGRLWGHRDVMQLVWGAIQAHKPVVAIDEGIVVAAQSELLAFRDAACPPSEVAQGMLRKHHVEVVDLPLVESDNGFITVAGSEGVAELGHVLLNRLGLQEAEVVTTEGPAPL